MRCGAKEEWLKAFLVLPGGIPSHDTFNRSFSSLNPEELESCFMDWTRSVANLCENEVVGIDVMGGQKDIALYNDANNLQRKSRHQYKNNTIKCWRVSKRLN
jgi:hypothetical protein